MLAVREKDPSSFESPYLSNEACQLEVNYVGLENSTAVIPGGIPMPHDDGKKPNSIRVFGINGGCTLWVFIDNRIYELHLINGERVLKRKAAFKDAKLSPFAFAESKEWVYVATRNESNIMVYELEARHSRGSMNVVKIQVRPINRAL